ncbi:MAG: signal peptide peptidase SppA [Planctomycetales bacterium]|nr:signal peptide peptidase SppA [Planctomycetales bacterium]
MFPESKPPVPPPPPPPPHPPQTIVIQQRLNSGGRLRSLFFWMILLGSLVANLQMYSAYRQYFAAEEGPAEQYHSGDKTSDAKIALVEITGTIMPPFTKHVLDTIQHVKTDDDVKGVVLVIDSPGGLVSDSHEIYEELRKLRDKKPIVVQMKSMAASGGYYVAMGAGEKAKIFAEPTTWTGSIGVIIPHYEVTELAEKFGVKAVPLKTGEFKDSLSPFRELTVNDRKVWDNILDQAFQMFLGVIDDNRSNLDMPQLKLLATGQVFTAKDAKANGLIDEIGYLDDAVAHLKKQLQIDEARVVRYHSDAALLDLLLGSTKAPDPSATWKAILEASVPRAMYFCSGLPILPPSR